MDFETILTLSYYKEIAEISSEHGVTIVQHKETNKIYVKKVMDIYNRDVYSLLQAHPLKGIPCIQEVCQADDQLILIEEYISGSTLEEVMSNKSYDEKFILMIAFSLCHIVGQIHAMTPPLVHRDIKPSNIMITPQNNVILLDFNAAKFYSDEKSSDTILLGTQGYAAPEQYGFGSSSPSTDIYAIGMVLREMIEASGLTDPEFDRIICKCTRMDPSARYSSAAELELNLLSLHKSGSDPSYTTRSYFPAVSDHSDSSPHSYLFPGLGSKHLAVRFLSLIGYLLLLYTGMTCNYTDASPAANWILRVCTCFLFLSVIFVLCNYRNVQRMMPLCQNKNPLIRILGTILLAVIDLGIFILLMSIILAFGQHSV